MTRTTRSTGINWLIPPLLVFFVGAMLTSVISHAISGTAHTVVMVSGFTLDAIAVAWAVFRWRKAHAG